MLARDFLRDTHAAHLHRYFEVFAKPPGVQVFRKNAGQAVFTSWARALASRLDDHVVDVNRDRLSAAVKSAKSSAALFFSLRLVIKDADCGIAPLSDMPIHLSTPTGLSDTDGGSQGGATDAPLDGGAAVAIAASNLKKKLVKKRTVPAKKRVKRTSGDGDFPHDMDSSSDEDAASVDPEACAPPGAQPVAAPATIAEAARHPLLGGTKVPLVEEADSLHDTLSYAYLPVYSTTYF